VVGVSVDPVVRLVRFKEKYDLHLPLVSDQDRAIGLAYGTLKGDASTKHERDTVVIGKDATVRLAYQRVGAKGHAAIVLADVERLRDQGEL
jgi:peroxiredoxin Q/BCP